MLLSMSTQQVKGPTQQLLLLASSYSLQLGGGAFSLSQSPQKPCGLLPCSRCKDIEDFRRDQMSLKRYFRGR